MKTDHQYSGTPSLTGRELTKHIFFSGKGGVGKTTMASATAVHYALNGKRTLIVTTDPASNLADVFEQEIGHRITPIDIGTGRAIPLLYAMEIDPDGATAEYRERIIGPFRELMPEDIIASLEEQFASPCTTEKAAFDRFLDFMDTDEYDIIVFDTASKGHTLRLLDLPFDYAKQVEMMVATGEGTGAKRVAQDRFKRIVKRLRNRDKTVFGLVLYPELTPIMESYRAMIDLKDDGIETQFVFANMILPSEVCVNDFFRNRRQMQIKYLNKIADIFKLPVVQLPMMQDEIKGMNSLQKAMAFL